VFGIVFSALVRRRAPAVTLLLLTILAAGAAAAAPQYVAAATRDVAIADLAASPVGDRVVTFGERFDRASITEEAVRDAATHVRAALRLPGLLAVDQVLVAGSVRPGSGTSSPLVYRQDVCAQLTIEGRCFEAPGEAVVSVGAARAFGFVLGGPVRHSATTDGRPTSMIVVGIYRPRDPYAGYWAGGELVNPEQAGAAAPAANGVEAVFAALPTVLGSRPTTADVAIDLVASTDLFEHADPAEVLDAVVDAEVTLVSDGYTMDAGLRTLAERARDDQLRVVRGVPATLIELLGLCWFALYLSVRYASFERRTDIGLLKLRGVGRLRTLLLVLGQSAAPMLVGGAVGFAAGTLTARPPAGTVTAEAARLADLSSVAAAAIAVLGALVAAFVAERRAVAEPAASLLRRVPPRPSGWRASVIDLALVGLATVGVYQVRSYSGGEAGWLALLAPGLLALALGVLVARLLIPVATAAGRSALRAGRLSTALTAAYLVRRPGLLRLCAVLTVAVALFGAAYAAYDTSGRAINDRAAHELGADRVLGVDASSRAQLLAAVRAVDPDGRYAMAAAYSPGIDALALDTPRLASVTRWRPEYGLSTAEQAAAALHPPAPGGLRITGREVTVAATANAAAPVSIMVRLTAPDGRATAVTLGPVRAGRHEYRAPAPDCAGDGGCRLVSVGLSAPAPPFPPGVDVQIHALNGASAGLTDRPLWRTPFVGGPPRVSTDENGLRLATGPAPVAWDLDATVSVLDAPVRLPVLAVGPARAQVAGADPPTNVFPQDRLPVVVAGGAGVLPRLGQNGLLFDLEYADRLAAPGGGAEIMEVWLAADAPPDVATQLAEHGVNVLTDSSVAERIAEYDAQALPVTLRFQLIIAAVAVLLAAGALGVVASVERGSRTAELAALRVQGMTDRRVRRTVLGGYAVVVLLPTLVGLATAFLARTAVAVDVPLFGDGWAGLTAPAAIRAWSAAFPVLTALAVFGAVVAGAAFGLVRRTRPGVEGTR
jgi:putative ABC transport system permease protein